MSSTPGVVNYPTSLDDVVSLIQAANNAATALTSSVTSGSTSLPVTSTTGNSTSPNGDSSGAMATRFTATRYGVGNILSIIELNGAAMFTYDNTYQLVNENRSGPSPVNSTHVYDPVGNRLNKTTNGAPSTFAYDAANQITGDQTPDGSHDYAFDGAGNMTGVTAYDLAHTVTGVGTLTYDGENRLVAQVGVTGPSDAQSFTYDGDGKRRQATDGVKGTRFVWDGENVLQDLDAGNPLLPLLAQYTAYPGYWGGLISRRGAIPTSSRGSLFNARRFNAARFNEAGDMELPSRFFGFDLMGNTCYLMDESGAITDSYIYEAFGDELYASGTDLNPYRFGGLVGYRRDRINVYYVRNRYYMALLARWLTVEPLGFGGEFWNWYGYVGNEPVNTVDPSGKLPSIAGTFEFFGKSYYWWYQLLLNIGCGVASAYQFYSFGKCVTDTLNFHKEIDAKCDPHCMRLPQSYCDSVQSYQYQWNESMAFGYLLVGNKYWNKNCAGQIAGLLIANHFNLATRINGVPFVSATD